MWCLSVPVKCQYLPTFYLQGDRVPHDMRNNSGLSLTLLMFTKERLDLLNTILIISWGSVADPDPTDPHVFGSPGSGSGSISQKYGSESFYH